jgi:hypothetical protein
MDSLGDLPYDERPHRQPRSINTELNNTQNDKTAKDFDVPAVFQRARLIRERLKSQGDLTSEGKASNLDKLNVEEIARHYKQISKALAASRPSASA